MKIALGTVQYGMRYGVSNKFDQVRISEVGKILKYANRKHIRLLDTAPSYGNSEDGIGKIIHNQSRDKYWEVVTKTPPAPANPTWVPLKKK